MTTRLAAVPLLALAAAPAAALADDDDDDGDRTEVLFFGAEGGIGWANLKMVKYDSLLPEIADVQGSGPTFGVHGLARILFVAVGLRAQVLKTDDFDVWHVNLEGQLRFPSVLFEMYVRLGLGYAFLGTDFQGEDPTTNGFDAQLGAGLDLFPADWLSVGPAVDLTFLNLTRSGGPTEVYVEQDGSAAGLGFHLAAVLSLRI